MTRSGILHFGAATLLLVGAVCLGACDPAPEAATLARSQHLLLITVDTLRADRMGCYGAERDSSPFLDRLAASGTLFQQAYSPRGLTVPSMISFFTSKYPAEHGVLNNFHRLSDAETVLAELLSGQGFRTRALVANGVLRPDYSNIEQGFASGDYQILKDEALLTATAEQILRSDFGTEGTRQFLWVHYMNPHKPYVPPESFQEIFVAPGSEGRFNGSKRSLDRIYTKRVKLKRQDREHIEDLYAATIRYVDSLVERLIGALRASGKESETLVVFASDHGEDLYSHNFYYYHENSVYRSSTAIPLVFYQPGAVQEQRREDLVMSLDLLPTVLSWLGVGAPEMEAHRGLDLSATLAESTPTRRSYVFAAYEDDIFSVRDHQWMYVHNPSQITPDGPPQDGHYPIAERELYDLATDPDEQRNVLAEHPEVTARLHQAVLQFQESLQRVEVSEISGELDAEQLRELQALGYLDEGEDKSGEDSDH